VLLKVLFCNTDTCVVAAWHHYNCRDSQNRYRILFPWRIKMKARGLTNEAAWKLQQAVRCIQQDLCYLPRSEQMVYFRNTITWFELQPCYWPRRILKVCVLENYNYKACSIS